MPLQIEKLFPDLWVDEESEEGKNLNEAPLIQTQIDRFRKKYSFSYNKVHDSQYGEKLKELIKIFDDPNKIKEIVAEDNGENQVTAIMPKGTELIWKDDMAIVTTDVRLSKKEIGKLMVMGPRRMEYNRVLSLMSLISKALDDIYK